MGHDLKSNQSNLAQAYTQMIWFELSAQCIWVAAPLSILGRDAVSNAARMICYNISGIAYCVELSQSCWSGFYTDCFPCLWPLTSGQVKRGRNSGRSVYWDLEFQEIQWPQWEFATSPDSGGTLSIIADFRNFTSQWLKPPVFYARGIRISPRFPWISWILGDERPCATDFSDFFPETIHSSTARLRPVKIDFLNSSREFQQCCSLGVPTCT